MKNFFFFFNSFTKYIFNWFGFFKKAIPSTKWYDPDWDKQRKETGRGRRFLLQASDQERGCHYAGAKVSKARGSNLYLASRCSVGFHNGKSVQ